MDGKLLEVRAASGCLHILSLWENDRVTGALCVEKTEWVGLKHPGRIWQQFMGGRWELPLRPSGKESACNVGATGNAGSIPGLGRSPGEGHGNPVQYSCLENPMDRRAWWATVHRVAKSQTWLKQLSTHACRHVCTQGWKKALSCRVMGKRDVGGGAGWLDGPQPSHRGKKSRIGEVKPLVLFVCVLPLGLFSSCSGLGLISSCCGFSYWGSWALECAGFSSCGTPA